MKCPRCRSDNPEAMHFCGTCGAKLESACSACGGANPPAFKFCGHCGCRLKQSPAGSGADPSLEAKLAKLQRYLPTGLTEKILAQKDTIEGEHKQITVMFIDLAGYTAFTEHVGAECSYTTMDQLFEFLIRRVHQYGGTVNRLTGDGLMALFGAPIAVENGPQRAVRAALDIHKEMARFSSRLQRERPDIEPLRLRIGINSGPVVVGSIGNDLRVEFTAMGDTVNLASRMEGLAEPGTTYVTEAIFKLTEIHFRFESQGEKRVKGMHRPVKTYRAISPSTRRSGFDVSAERGLTAFVGRTPELKLLLDGFDLAKAGWGQAFSTVAEAGLGKSRLAYEFRKSLANEDVTVLVGRCRAYSRSSAYYPFVNILKSRLGIGDDEKESQVVTKVRREMKRIGADEPDTLPFILELLSVKDSGADSVSMSQEARKERIRAAIARSVLLGSRQRPIIMVIEDLHWVDKSSQACLNHLVDTISGARVMLIFTYRPEFVHDWEPRSYHNRLTLSRLNQDASSAMMTDILETERVAPQLRDTIIEKTEGNPFFMEELLKSLRDLNVISKHKGRWVLAKDMDQAAIPSTIQDVIMARVDALPEMAKDVLQAGSAIEREFDYPLMRAVAGLPDPELLEHLDAIKKTELLYQRGVPPDSTFIFKHALTRQVVYDSILSERKRRLHNTIGQAIEDLHGSHLPPFYGVLAEHYIRSQSFSKGAEFAKLAGKTAARAGSLEEAITYARKRIHCLEKLPLTEAGQKKIIDCRTALGIHCLTLNYLAEAKAAVDPVVETAEALAYQQRLSQVYTIIGAHKYWAEENFEAAFDRLGKALQIAEGVDDIVSFFVANYWLGFGLSLNAEFDKALTYFDKGLEFNVAIGNIWGISAMNSVKSYFVHYLRGDIEASFQSAQVGLEYAEKSGDIYSKALASTSYGVALFGRGNFEDAVDHLGTGADLCRRIHLFSNQALANFFLGKTFYETGNWDRSRTHFDRCATLVQRNGLLPSWVNLSKIGSQRAQAGNAERNVDVQALFDAASANRVNIYRGWTPRFVAETLLTIDGRPPTEARFWIEKALEADTKTGMCFHLARDHRVCARICRIEGDLRGAREQMGRAASLFSDCGAHGFAAAAEQELAAIA